jgi:hypothetical protein
VILRDKRARVEVPFRGAIKIPIAVPAIAPINKPLMNPDLLIDLGFPFQSTSSKNPATLLETVIFG